jgi:transcriptional regulator of acetoin/glycerol metabolism
MIRAIFGLELLLIYSDTMVINLKMLVGGKIHLNQKLLELKVLKIISGLQPLLRDFLLDSVSNFVEKSRIEIIVKNSAEAEEIKKYIEALEKTNWSIRAAAKLLNIPHSTFHYRLKKLNLLKNKQEG